MNIGVSAPKNKEKMLARKTRKMTLKMNSRSERFLFRVIWRLSRVIISCFMAWIFVAGQIAFAESFPRRPTPKQLEAIVALPRAVNERCLATQYSIAPPRYWVYPPFTGGVRLDPDTLELIAVTIRALLPWYVDTDTVKDGSPAIDMLSEARLWPRLEIGDRIKEFTATAAACDPNAVYGDRPARVSGLHLNERAKVLNKLKSTTLSADIFQRKHGSDYTGISDWGEAISAAETSYENNGGGMGPFGTWSTYSVATWSTTRERPWLHYRPTIVRVVKGGLTVVHSGDILSNLASLAVFMSATKYEGGEIGVQNFEFNDNGLGGLTDGWVWNVVKLFWGPFWPGQQLLFIDNAALPAECADPKNKTPPGSMVGYVTASPDGRDDRAPLGMANWRFTLLPTDLPVISVVKVEFNKNPVQVGLGANRTTETPAYPATMPATYPHRLIATIMPKDAAGPVTFDSSSVARMTVAEVSRSDVGNTKQVVLQVTGVSKTPEASPGGDADVRALPNGTPCKLTKAVVVVPTAIHSPHPEFDGVVAGQNLTLDSTTSPSANVGAGNVLLASMYMTFLTITVDDQLGNTLHAIYGGSPVTEYGGIAINQLMTASGTYSDPVGSVIISGVVPAEYPPGTPNPAIAAFLASPVPPAPSATVVQNIPVEVDGHSLNPAVANRKVTTSPPDNLKIEWP